MRRGMFMGVGMWSPHFGGSDQLDLITSGNPPTTKPVYVPNTATFQVRPCSVKRWPTGGAFNPNPPECGGVPRCDANLPQTPHASGMLAALADGSVRTIHPGVRTEIVWGAVTPAGGEILGDW